ncbi:MAG: VOC family protein [Candidatus Saccharicenans sp.]|jgi:catechol 2,3-dioxygenase-like lactoylglutathione lyase family enzyme|nr:VOC family protein [Candidatus Saccharicenans sp.]MDH7575321.1 VOC family protein [Candidatus Saccharicenans sp.]
MKIRLLSIPVADQDKALRFYTEKLGFILKKDIPLGEARWLTLVSPEDPEGPELLLEPNAEYPAMKALKESLVRDGIPIAAFAIDNIKEEFARLKENGVNFTLEPTDFGTAIVGILDDTCGNLIQIYQEKTV